MTRLNVQAIEKNALENVSRQGKLSKQKSMVPLMAYTSLFVTLGFILLQALHDIGSAHLHFVRRVNDAQSNPPVYLDFVNDEDLKRGGLQALKSNTPYLFKNPHDGEGYLCFQVWHPPPSVELSSAPPVVYFAGLGGSRLEHFISSGDSQDRVVITIDRPGLGRSSRLVGAVPPSFFPPSVRYGQVSSVVSSLLVSLGVQSYSLVGWSSGGPYALGLYRHAPLAVASVSLVASDPPWGAVPWQTVLSSPLHLSLLLLARLCPYPHHIGLVVNALANVAAGWTKVRRGDEAEHVSKSFAEGLREGSESATALGEEFLAERDGGWAALLLDTFGTAAAAAATSAAKTKATTTTTTGEEEGESAPPVYIYHSPGDRVVPFASATFLQRSIKGATLVTMPPMHVFTREEGHYIMRKHWADIVYY